MTTCSEPGCGRAVKRKFGRGWYCLEHFQKRVDHNTARRRAQASTESADVVDVHSRRARGLAVLAEQAREVDRAATMYRRALRALAREEGLVE